LERVTLEEGDKRALPLPSPVQFRCNAKRASLVQSRIKALEKMVEIKGIEEDPEYVFRCWSLSLPF